MELVPVGSRTSQGGGQRNTKNAAGATEKLKQGNGMGAGSTLDGTVSKCLQGVDTRAEG